MNYDLYLDVQGLLDLRKKMDDDLSFLYLYLEKCLEGLNVINEGLEGEFKGEINLTATKIGESSKITNSLISEYLKAMDIVIANKRQREEEARINQKSVNKKVEESELVKPHIRLKPLKSTPSKEELVEEKIKYKGTEQKISNPADYSRLLAILGGSALAGTLIMKAKEKKEEKNDINENITIDMRK